MSNIADVVVVGGGIIGCSTAYNLARLGAGKVILLERGYLASGSTGRCGAGTRMQWGTETNCLLSRESTHMLENLAELLEVDVDIELHQGGYLMPAYTEKMAGQFKKNLELQNTLDIPARWVTPQEAKEIVPLLNTDGMIGATFCAKDGHCNPFKATEAYARAARRLGVEIRTYTEVTGLDAECCNIRKVKTTTGDISTSHVVMAAGGYSKPLCRTVGVEIPLYPERHEILVTEPVDPVQEAMVMSFHHNLYCQQSPHGSFIMGIGHPDLPESFDTRSSWEFLQEMARRVLKVLPGLAGLNVIRQWAGLYDMSPDRQPILGPVGGVDGLHIAAGFSGHGFMISPVVGRIVAEKLLGLPTVLPVDMFDAGRFQRGELFIEPSVV